MSKKFVSSKIVMLLLDAIRVRPGNPRVYGKRHRRALMKSIARYGFTVPVLIDGKNMIVAGAARVDAARELGMTEVPVIRLDHLSEAELLAYRIADNRVSDFSDWDRALLPAAFLEITDLDPDFELTDTFFDVEEIEQLGDLRSKKIEEAELPRATNVGKAVTQSGDMFVIGRHRLLCGNARHQVDYLRLLGRERADMVMIDPPYNCRIGGHVSGLGKNVHREFLEASGEMSSAEFRSFLHQVLSELVRFSRSGSLHYIFSDWRMLGDLTSVAESLFTRQVNLAVWVKPNGGMGSFLRSRHELVAIYQRGKRSHINNVALGASGRNRTNVWEYPGASSFSATRDEDLRMHPTVKNVDMIADAIKDASHSGDIVVDVFGGSGTTLVACESTGRLGRLIELDPLYCDVIARRCLAIGLDVRLADTGETFLDLEHRRKAEAESAQQPAPAMAEVPA